MPNDWRDDYEAVTDELMRLSERPDLATVAAVGDALRLADQILRSLVELHGRLANHIELDAAVGVLAWDVAASPEHDDIAAERARAAATAIRRRAKRIRELTTDLPILEFEVIDQYRLEPDELAEDPHWRVTRTHMSEANDDEDSRWGSFGAALVWARQLVPRTPVGETIVVHEYSDGELSVDPIVRFNGQKLDPAPDE